MRFRYRDALAHRSFRAIFAAQLVSITGSSVAAVALTVLVYERTSSPFLSSLTFALGFVPYLLGGSLLSAFVDRVPPRQLVARCDSISAVLAATMAWPHAPTVALLVLLVAVGALQSISGGARAALVRAVVPDDAYVPARSLLRIVSQTAQIFGNAVGGVLLVVLTPSGALLVNAASFAASASLVRIGVRHVPLSALAPVASVLRESLAGIRDVFADHELRRLLLLGWLVPTFSVAPEALAAPYVVSHGGSPSLVGVWLLALPIGMIVGDLLGVWRLTAAGQRRAVGPAAAASFVPYLCFGFGLPVAIALPLLTASGLCSLYSLGLDLQLRDAAPPEQFARVMTINQAGLMTLQGLGFALAGAEAELVGAPAAIAVAGACGLAVAMLFGRPRRDRAAGAQASETVVSSRASA
jgi:predicted MFS family arabinose efflux permease